MKKDKQQKLFSRPNPFNQVSTKPKFDVLNRKIKGSKGNPGISKSKNLQFRKETLLGKLKNKNRNSKFFDKRIGAKDGLENNDFDDVMMDRFAAERLKSASKYSIDTSHQDSLSLTHRGRSIDEIDSFSEHSESEEDSDVGRIDPDVVFSEHFAGYDQEHGADQQGKRSRAEIMREVIAKSKAHKRERQRVKEENENLRDELNDEFDEIRGILFSNDIVDDSVGVNKGALDTDYDLLVQEYATEKKSKPTDRLKTQEELAFEERTKLEELEKERLNRMKVAELDDEENTISNEELASDEEEEYEVIESDEEEECEAIESDDIDNNETFSEHESVEDSESDNYSEIENKEGCDENEDDSESDEYKDSYSEMENKNDINLEPLLEKASSVLDALDGSNEIPFIIPIPSNYKETKALFSNRNFSDTVTIYKRIIVYHSPLAHPESKPKLASFHSNMLKFLCNNYMSFSSSENLNEIFNIAIGQSKLFPLETTIFFKSLIFRQYDELKRIIQNNQRISNIDALLLFTAKIVFSLFSTSDFYNPVVTPMYLLLSFIFEHLSVSNNETLLRVLYLIDLYVESQRESRRIMPEMMNCLYSCLACFYEQKPTFYFIKPFETIKLNVNHLHPDKTLNFDLLIYSPQNERENVCIHSVILHCIDKFCNIYHTNVAFVEMFLPFYELLPIPNQFTSFLESALQMKKPLQLHLEKPRCIPTLEPDFEFGYSLDSRLQKNANEEERAMNETKKLKAQIKSEKKALIKDIRRDNAFINSFKYEKRMKEDDEYKRRINQIMGQIGNESSQPKSSKPVSKKKLLKF